MSITLKGKWLLLAVFIFGCATGPAVQKYLSFKDAVAKTGSKCQYTRTHVTALGLTAGMDKSPALDYSKSAKILMSKGWKLMMSAGDSGIVWEKCKG